MASILIIHGSPRKKGNTATLAARLAEGAVAAGASVETVYLGGLKIAPCLFCDTCKKEGADFCAVKDDMAALYPKLQAADVIVFATPVFWFNISAQLKTFIDRLYAIGPGYKEFFAGKRFAVLLAYADADPLFSGAANAVRCIQDMADYVGVPIVEAVHGSADKVGAIAANREVMDKAHRLGAALAGA